MKIYIFSEVCYNDNKHINQYLFDYLTKKGINCYFIERVSMKIPLKGYLNRFRRKIKNSTSDRSKNENIIKIFILPPLNIFKKINRYIFNKRKLILNSDDVIISFVPHEHVFKISGEKSKWVYYCVHDSTQQNYPCSNNIINFERNILTTNSIVFCDNEDVINKLGLDIIEYPNKILHDKVNTHAYLMPPPVPNEFYNNNDIKYDIIYDYVYYGSFHKDIDLDILISISKKSSLLIISNNCPPELTKEDTVTILPSIYIMTELADAINSAQCILLPYKNSKFMETITPAKILQVKAFSKPVVCTNNFLAKKYGLSCDINNTTPPPSLSSIFSVEEICEFIFNRIESQP